ncbi:MAG: hypothetical protein WCS37_09690 [Chloroflexota bacterium]
MGQRNTRHIGDYLDDFEQAAKDYAELGPLWAELVFPDDFEALKALYGGSESSGKTNRDNRKDKYQDKERNLGF